MKRLKMINLPIEDRKIGSAYGENIITSYMHHTKTHSFLHYNLLMFINKDK